MSEWTVIAVKKETKDRLDKFMANLIYKTSYDEMINDYLDDLQR